MPNTFLKYSKYYVVLFTTVLLTVSAFAQSKDTIAISGKNISTKALKNGSNHYLVYFKMKKDATRTQTQFWTRNIERIDYNGKAAIKITQEWEDKDSIVHTVTSVCDETTMQPYYHQSWWKQRGISTYDFLMQAAEINGKQLSDADTTKARKQSWQAFKETWNGFSLNWHLDLEVFSTLPFKKNVTFLIPYYEPGSAKPKSVAYTVSGSGTLMGYNNKEIDCWLLTHESPGNKELFYISKKTKEVLKLEQEINGTMYRYKIKLPFSN